MHVSFKRFQTTAFRPWRIILIRKLSKIHRVTKNTYDKYSFVLKYPVFVNILHLKGNLSRKYAELNKLYINLYFLVTRNLVTMDIILHRLQYPL